jgi:hypothetical protein
MYLSVTSRPDITHTLSVLSQYCSNYSLERWKLAKRVLRYFKNTINKCITYKKTAKNLIGFVDTDWGECRLDRHSYSGYVFQFAEGAVSWASKKQRCVSLSSTELEYVSLSEGTMEAIFYKT